jgi:hypothetical protein
MKYAGDYNILGKTAENAFYYIPTQYYNAQVNQTFKADVAVGTLSGVLSLGLVLLVVILIDV